MFNNTKKRKKNREDGSPALMKRSNLNAAAATGRSIQHASKWNGPSGEERDHECSSQLAHPTAKPVHHHHGKAAVIASDGVDRTALRAERQNNAAIAPAAALTMLHQQRQQQLSLEGVIASSAPLQPWLPGQYHHHQQQQPIGLWQRSSLWLHHGEQQPLLNNYWSQAVANDVAASAATSNNIFIQQQGIIRREEILRRLAYQSSAGVAMGRQTTMLPTSVVSSLVPPNFIALPGVAATARALIEIDLSRSFPSTTQPPPSSQRPSHYQNNQSNHNTSTPSTIDPLHHDSTTDPNCELPPRHLPTVLALPGDRLRLSQRQVFLRHQIEVFEATEDDVMTYTRGRNKRIKLRQVGIRCRHCAHVPVADKQRGAVYFPATLLGLYQAGQNMSTIHLQCGLCTHTPDNIKRTFITLMETTGLGLGAGRAYWMQAGKQLGLVDTEDEGIRFGPQITTTTTSSPPEEVAPDPSGDN